MNFKLLWFSLCFLFAAGMLSAQEHLRDPAEYLNRIQKRPTEIRNQLDFKTGNRTYWAVEYKNSDDEARLAVFVAGTQWELVQDFALSADIANDIYAVMVDADAKGIHCEVYREGDSLLVDEDWILEVSPDTVVPEYYAAAHRRLEAGRKITAQEALILSSHLWWHFREDHLLDLAASPVAGVRIISAPDYFLVADRLGNEVGEIEVVARLFAANNGDQYLLVSPYFENGGEWPHVDEYLVRFSGTEVSLMPAEWKEGLSFRSFLHDPEMELSQEGTEAEDVWFRINQTSASIWVGCRYDPAFAAIQVPNGVYFIEDLKYKAIEFVWDEETARFTIGQKILR